MRGLHLQKEITTKAVLGKNHPTLLNYVSLKIQFSLAWHRFLVQIVFLLVGHAVSI
jgi:hypothetical protein